MPTRAEWEDDVSRGSREGQCQACDRFAPLDDLGLCADCGAKLERDLLRQREWDYAAAAFGLPAEAREALRRDVIARYGAALELIVPPEEAREGRARRRRGRQRAN